jgi:DNA-directed RNA polymerase specialized sigma24 family protein
MMLNHYAGLSFKEISETLLCSLNAVLDRMEFGLSNQRKLMTEQQEILQ